MGEKLIDLLRWMDPTTVWRPYLASMIGTVLALSQASQDTKPISNVCANCNGTGIVGDGTIELECSICGGDGILGN